MAPSPTIGLCAQLACIWEATARKPGNVHRYQDFADTSYLDFLTSAAALAPVLSNPDQSVGTLVLEGVRATRQVARPNTNLGIILLLAPLARAAGRAVRENLRCELERVLEELRVEDARLVYEAIRLVQPGGLGSSSQQDVRNEPTVTLREAMILAADRDGIARQYANGYREVFEDGVPALWEGLARKGSLEGAIIHAQLVLMSRLPDTLIARKGGPALAQESAQRAQAVLAGEFSLAEFDAWLRAEGNRRNPGTTADLLAACLFVALIRGEIGFRPEVPWSLE